MGRRNGEERKGEGKAQEEMGVRHGDGEGREKAKAK